MRNAAHKRAYLIRGIAASAVRRLRRLKTNANVVDAIRRTCNLPPTAVLVGLMFGFALIDGIAAVLGLELIKADPFLSGDHRLDCWNVGLGRKDGR